MKKELDLFLKLTDEIIEAEKDHPVVKPIDPNTLHSALDIGLEDDPVMDDRFESALRDLVMNTPRTASKRFFNQLFGGRNSKAVLGDLLAVVLNTSMYTYKVGGPMIGVELEIIKQSCKIVGYGDRGTGTIPTGGSMSNLMAMIMARDFKKISVTREGISGKYVLYTSEHCHYSIPKNASFIGIGLDQVRKIKTDEQGRMIPSEIELAIEADLAAGNIPFMIIATAGTTVLGAIDPIEPLNRISKKYNLWMHIDGAYCGSIMFTEKYKHLIKGVEESDSFCYNAHKMIGTPLTCSIFLTKHKDAMHESFSIEADYLYQTDHDEFDLGKTSLQCGRRNDALKFWAVWKSIGTKGIRRMVEHHFHLADVARDYVRSHPDYTLYSYDNSVSVCFNYKGIPAKALCKGLYQNAEILVGYGEFKDQQFVRLVTINSQIKDEDVIAFFKTLESFASQMTLV